jgi:hypothetical protein
MTTKFNFDEVQLKILANFSSISQQMLVEPDKFSVISSSKSVIANYPFTTPFDFEPFGLYNTSDFIGILSIMKQAEIEVKDKFLSITAKSDKITYYTTAKELVPIVPDTNSLFKTLDESVALSLPADRIAIIMKASAQFKSKYMFIESITFNTKKLVRITIGDELETSANSYELVIDDATINNLTEPVRISMEDFKLIGGEYTLNVGSKQVKGKTKYLSKWSNLNGVTYFIATNIVDPNAN